MIVPKEQNGLQPDFDTSNPSANEKFNIDTYDNKQNIILPEIPKKNCSCPIFDDIVDEQVNNPGDKHQKSSSPECESVPTEILQDITRGSIEEGEDVPAFSQGDKGNILFDDEDNSFSHKPIKPKETDFLEEVEKESRRTSYSVLDENLTIAKLSKKYESKDKDSFDTHSVGCNEETMGQQKEKEEFDKVTDIASDIDEPDSSAVAPQGIVQNHERKPTTEKTDVPPFETEDQLQEDISKQIHTEMEMGFAFETVLPESPVIAEHSTNKNIPFFQNMRTNWSENLNDKENKWKCEEDITEEAPVRLLLKKRYSRLFDRYQN